MVIKDFQRVNSIEEKSKEISLIRAYVFNEGNVFLLGDFLPHWQIRHGENPAWAKYKYSQIHKFVLITRTRHLYGMEM